MAVSRLFLCMKTVRPRAVPEPKIKNEICHEMAKKLSISGIFWINPKLLIRILMF